MRRLFVAACTHMTHARNEQCAGRKVKKRRKRTKDGHAREPPLMDIHTNSTEFFCLCLCVCLFVCLFVSFVTWYEDLVKLIF